MRAGSGVALSGSEAQPTSVYGPARVGLGTSGSHTGGQQVSTTTAAGFTVHAPAAQVQHPVSVGLVRLGLMRAWGKAAATWGIAATS